jgi:chromosomal replication initiator protein
MQIVADHFRVSVEDLQSASRQKHLTQPRFIIYFLARKLTSLSSPKIGRDIGNRDHTSVIHGSKAFHTLVKFDPEFRAKAEACEEKVLSMMQPVGRAQE